MRSANASAGLDRPIVLVGHMGCGKTAVGRRLAEALGLPFRDSDAEVEAAAGLPIPEIFARFGEAHFRDGERRVIARLLGEGPAVIATGGGAFMDPDTRALALARAIVVWIEADLDLLAERVARKGGRPLLAGRDPREVLAELARVRDPVYAKAHLRVRSSPGPHEETVAAILHALAQPAA
ncbi:MAG: shikimate kinase [Sphingomonadaceae bacterium]|uniref:shikimate kinase n=1 Tax=Thermaurantiacus sp. TaxID=2820283 RepID=UPI00298F17D0|nr:shikimate kinase [Thermaurantiacus sp.]MCS6987225.1 shikimate kinase [Sphingomonadaceae bacterium]MDW8414445.1 shikimate kinase [Thermaurantiacus sp.]